MTGELPLIVIVDDENPRSWTLTSAKPDSYTTLPYYTTTYVG